MIRLFEFDESFIKKLVSHLLKIRWLQEGEAPLTPDQGLCPLTPLGANPPDPQYRLALPRSPWGSSPQYLQRIAATEQLYFNAVY